MAHFAELDADNRVLRVVVVSNQDIRDRLGREREALGVAFCRSLFGAETRWVQTSYNASSRGKFAGVGDVYDAAQNKFISPDE
jgi:hypothetical protein